MIPVYRTGERIRFNVEILSPIKLGSWGCKLVVPQGPFLFNATDCRNYANYDAKIEVVRAGATVEGVPVTMDYVKLSGRENIVTPRGGKVIASVIATLNTPHETQWNRAMLESFWSTDTGGNAMEDVDNERFANAVVIWPVGYNPLKAYWQVTVMNP